MTGLPLCVDMDGTLLRTDTLCELVWRALVQKPLALFKVVLSFLCHQNRATLKQQLSGLIPLETIQFPYNPEFVAWLQQQHALGRPLYLVTAADYAVARAVASRLNLFTAVIASDGQRNLLGVNKAQELVSRFGRGKFAYAGNEAADYSVWEQAGESIVVCANSTVVTKATEVTPSNQASVFDCPKEKISVFLKAIRLHQWAKNILIFLPLIVGHKYTTAHNWYLTLCGMLAFSFMASSVYLLNDALDLDTDRQHHRKYKRPLACGDLSLFSGLLWSLCLFTVALILACGLLGILFTLILMGYYVLTLAYSLWLKRICLVDIFTLAILYSVRVIAGVVLVSAFFSPWLIAFSMFFFLSLACVKRFSELLSLQTLNQQKMRDKMYYVDDIETIKIFGITAGYIAVLILAIYINSDMVILYESPLWLWGLIILVLFWVTRTWLLASRGAVDEDPITYALKDKTTLVLLPVAALFFYLSQ